MVRIEDSDVGGDNGEPGAENVSESDCENRVENVTSGA